MRSSPPLRRPHAHHVSLPRSMNRSSLRLRCAPPSHLRDSRSVWQEAVEVALHHSHRDSAHVIWRAYGRSSLPPFSWPERLGQAGSRYSMPSKTQITFSSHAVLLCLVRHPMAPVQLLVRRVSVVEHRLKDRWNNNRGIRRQHIHSLRTWILKACKLPYGAGTGEGALDVEEDNIPSARTCSWVES